MIDLSERSGLPLALDDAGMLVFGKGMVTVEPDVRTIDDARGVLWNMTAAEPKNLYYMYRGVMREADMRAFRVEHIRYDVTIVMPGKVGGEFVKTVGHYHPEVPGTGVRFPEVYEVIYGKAHYLLQKVDETGLIATDVVIIEAGPGEKVLIPPGYGHITINPGTEPLVMCNLIEDQFKSEYEPMQLAHGGAYYEVEEDGEPVFVENERYEEPPDPRLLEPKEIWAQESPLVGKPLYPAFMKMPAAFGFLVRPHLHAAMLNSALL